MKTVPNTAFNPVQPAAGKPSLFTSPPSLREARRGTYAFRAALGFLLATLINLPINAVIAYRTGAWQMYALVVFGVVLVMILGRALKSIREGRIRTGAWQIIRAALSLLVMLSILLQGTGLILGLVGSAIIVMLSTQILSPSEGNRAIFWGVLANITAGLVDFWSPGFQLAAAGLPVIPGIIGTVVLLILIINTLARFSEQNLSTKLVLAFLTIALIPLGMLHLVNSRDTRLALTSAADRALSSAATQTGKEIDAFIQSNLDSINTEGQLPDLGTFLTLSDFIRDQSPQVEEVGNLLLQLRNKDRKFILSYGLLDTRGINLMDTSPGNIGRDESGELYFSIPFQSGPAPYVSPVQVYQVEPTLRAMITFSRIVEDVNGNVVGVLRMQYDASILQKMLEEANGLAGQDSFGVLLDDYMIQLAHGASPASFLTGISQLSPNQIFTLKYTERLPDLPVSSLFEENEDLTERLYGFATPVISATAIIPGETMNFTANDIVTGDRLNQVAVSQLSTRPWIVAFFQPQEVFLTPIIEQTRSSLMVGMLTSNLIILAATFIVQALTGPITRLTSVAERVAGGELTAKAGVETEDEIGTLATAFNSMTNELRQIFRTLENRVADRTRAIETSADISRYISTLLDPDILLEEVVNEIQRAFNFYHVEIFLYNESQSTLQLHSGSGETGRQMMRAGLEIAPGEGLVGRCADQNRIIYSRDVHNEPGWIEHPLLPQTRSELCIPIAIMDRVLGVLDLQENKLDGFADLSARLMESIANQVAIALENARLYTRERARAEGVTALSETIRRVDVFAQKLLENPTNAIEEIYYAAVRAASDTAEARMLGNLPEVLENQNAAALAGLALGFRYLHTSRTVPEVLPAGLRALIDRLEAPNVHRWRLSDEALYVFQRTLRALDANSIAKISQFIPESATLPPDFRNTFLAGLAGFFPKALSVSTALRAYERVDTAQDKLAYLANAIERLRHLEYHARTELNALDGAIVEAIAENWFSVVTGAMTDLQTRAQIACQLVTRNILREEQAVLTFTIRNEGRGAALNLELTIALDEEAARNEPFLIDKPDPIDRLPPGAETQLTARIQTPVTGGGGQFRIRFSAGYTDPRGPDQHDHFADVIHLISEAVPFSYIPNPYVVGTPLAANSPLFFGREDVIAFIQENLSASHRNNLVLIGQRRTGKTSLLKQLPVRLTDEYIPVYIDGQTLGLDPGLPNFFLSLATEISFALEDRGFEIEPPELAEFTDSPAGVFEREFLGKVRRLIEGRHLLILLDEFEEIEAAVRRGHIDSSVFGFLRHLIQHSDNLSVIFCGTHRLEELASDYWNVLFNISLYRHIAYLERGEALRLVQEPVAKFGMRYDDLALDKMWRVTAGHPYFLQLLCHSLVNRQNRAERNYITVSDVNAALEEILSAGEAHFLYLWTGATSHERLSLTAMSRMVPLTGNTTPIQVVDYLSERGIIMSRQEISEALHKLQLKEILAVAENGDLATGELYRWKLGLVGMWAEKYKSLSRVVDEAEKEELSS
jgi:putative methionine-R-sulfoxide reductase with GAF domain